MPPGGGSAGAGTTPTPTEESTPFPMTPPLEPPQDMPGLRQDVLGWFIQRQGERWGPQDEAAFQGWLAADARHQNAFSEWEAHWATLDTVPAEAVARLRLQLARDKAREAAPPPTSVLGGSAAFPRRKFLKPAFATAAVVAVAGSAALLSWRQWQAQPLFTQTFRTERGQQTEVSLPDGSRLRLDTATQLEVAYFRRHREVRLVEGQAVFSVQTDVQRPFHVLAGAVQVSVVGTRFSVRHTPQLPGADGVRVCVEEGKVHVTRAGMPADDSQQSPSDAVLLAAGQQVQADTLGKLAPVVALPDEGMAPWRNHRVSFVNTPLAQAIAELDRYGNTGLLVRHPVVAAMRLSGTFDPRDAQTLRRILPAALPVRLVDRGTHLEVLPAGAG